MRCCKKAVCLCGKKLKANIYEGERIVSCQDCKDHKKVQRQSVKNIEKEFGVNPQFHIGDKPFAVYNRKFPVCEQVNIRGVAYFDDIGYIYYTKENDYSIQEKNLYTTQKEALEKFISLITTQ